MSDEIKKLKSQIEKLTKERNGLITEKSKLTQIISALQAHLHNTGLDLQITARNVSQILNPSQQNKEQNK